MTSNIVEITPNNKTLLANIADDVFDYNIAAPQLDAYLAQSNHKLIVAIVGDQVVGQIRGMIHFQPDEPPHLYVDNLGVAPEQKRKGIAKALFEALTVWAKAEGCVSFWVATETDNHEGNSFYRAIGLKGQTMYLYEQDI